MSNEIATVQDVAKNGIQAKSEAIGALTASAYARASQLMLTPEEREALTADFPDEAFRSGAAGKDNLIYIEHASLRDRLHEVIGPGQWSLIPRSRWTETFTYFRDDGAECQGITVYVEAMLMIRGCYVAEKIGDMVYYPENRSQNYADAYEGACTAALRRCCKELGVGLQAWKRDWCDGWLKRCGKKRSGSYSGAPMPPCPACTQTKAVIAGKEEYGGGFVCFKKKGGCGHKWAGEPEQPEATGDMDLVAEWTKKLDDDLIIGPIQLNELIPDFKAIPGQHKKRAAVWKMILEKGKSLGCSFIHGSRQFEITEQQQPKDA